jgi:hypothetical protein
MNIFILDDDPVDAAIAQCDKHIVKMPLESAQMLCTVAFAKGRVARYKPTHANHPCTLWVGESLSNWIWCRDHAIALCNEYTFRYGRRHASQDVIEELETPDFDKKIGTAFVQAMPDDVKDSDPVIAYRNYYRKYKKDFVSWRRRSPPDWFTQGDRK